MLPKFQTLPGGRLTTNNINKVSQDSLKEVLFQWPLRLYLIICRLLTISSETV